MNFGNVAENGVNSNQQPMFLMSAHDSQVDIPPPFATLISHIRESSDGRLYNILYEARKNKYGKMERCCYDGIT
ncbi:hypothetical protein [Blautia wexlerae]|uniref:hypothetical protein n=1 Tax=Blautia wexlerae TaxID=418240 RepID=UPI0034A4944F